MAQKDPFLVPQFDGGFNREDSSDGLDVNESPDMENAEFTNKSVKKMDGIIELGTDSDNEVPKKLFKAPNRNGINWLFKFSGTVLKIYNSTNEIWSVVKTGLTLGEKWGDVTFNNVLQLGSQVDDALSFDLSKITRLNGAITLGQAVIDVDSAAGMEATGDVYINDTLVSYTGKSATTLTGCTNAVATPDNYIVTQTLSVHASTPKGNMLIIFGGRQIIAGVTGSGGSTLYGSKATDRNDFTIAGGGAANDAFAEALIAQIKSIRTFYNDSREERIMAFMSNNEIWNVNVTDDADLGTLVASAFYKASVTALNHFATVVGKNDIFHVDTDNQIRTLGPRGVNDGSGINFSDSISRKHKSIFRTDYDFSNSAGAIVNGEYWVITNNDNGSFNNEIMIYVDGKWKRRTGIIANDIIELDDRVVIASAVLNKVYQIEPDKLDDDGASIKFKYTAGDYDINPLRFERLRAVRLAGIMSSNCIFTVEIFRDNGGQSMGKFILRGDNNDIIQSALSAPNSFGNIAFGGLPFGEDDVLDRKFFIAQLDLKSLPDFENFRVVIENMQQGVYLEIKKMKPFVFPQMENYFPKKYILEVS